MGRVSSAPHEEVSVGAAGLIADGMRFGPVCRIEPERDENGHIVVHTPQDRYANAGTAVRNRHGNGPFCRFRIPAQPTGPGVYAILVDGIVRYIGICHDLPRRWNAGYGNISPKNCYRGGQSTNCKVNHHIYEAAVAGRAVELWFCPTREAKATESRLIRALRPHWNTALT
jgi:hypothetical protein